MTEIYMPGEEESVKYDSHCGIWQSEQPGRRENGTGLDGGKQKALGVPTLCVPMG